MWKVLRPSQYHKRDLLNRLRTVICDYGEAEENVLDGQAVRADQNLRKPGAISSEMDFKTERTIWKVRQEGILAYETAKDQGGLLPSIR